MNPNLRVLATLAEDVEGRADVRLDEVRGRIRSARRRRQLGAVAGTAVAVVVALTAGSVAMSVLDKDASGPATPPGPAVTPTEKPQPPAPGPRSSRPLVWAVGTTVHVGDRYVDVGGRVLEVQGTDDGAVFMRAAHRDCFRIVGEDRAAVPIEDAGCNELYFTDGDGIEHIGTVYGSIIRGYELSASSSGSTLAWFEPSPEGHPGGSGYEHTGEYVVYDTRERREVARFGSDAVPDRGQRIRLRIEAVFDDAVYWTPDDRGREWCARYSRYYAACRRHTAVMRLDTSTGIQTKVGWSAYLEDRHSRPRRFLRSHGPDSGEPPLAFPENRGGYESLELERVGDRLVARDENGDVAGVRVAGTGKPVRLRVPAGYRPSGAFSVIQWLDDDRVVVLPEESQDLLVCRLSTGRCRLVVTGVAVANFRSWG